MIKYKRVYLEYFNLDPQDFIPCEITGQQAVDIHHIQAKGMGGSKIRDVIENLIAVTREAHDYFGDKAIYKDWLSEVHDTYMRHRIPWVDWNPECQILKEFLNGT